MDMPCKLDKSIQINKQTNNQSNIYITHDFLDFTARKKKHEWQVHNGWEQRTCTTQEWSCEKSVQHSTLRGGIT